MKLRKMFPNLRKVMEILNSNFNLLPKNTNNFYFYLHSHLYNINTILLLLPKILLIKNSFPKMDNYKWWILINLKWMNLNLFLKINKPLLLKLVLLLFSKLMMRNQKIIYSMINYQWLLKKYKIHHKGKVLKLRVLISHL